MRILVLADIHANLAALQAVLRDAGQWDRCLFAGDLVDYGPSPAECLALLRHLDPVAVKGNHDAAVTDGYQCGWYGGVGPAIRQHQAAALDDGQLAWLAALPAVRQVEVADVRFHLVHARPADPWQGYLLPGLPLEQMAAEMAEVEADTVLLGHAHHQYRRELPHMTIVNPGSVGQPRDGDHRAAYALWEDGRLSLRRVEYDVADTCRRLDETTLPEDDRQLLKDILWAGE